MVELEKLNFVPCLDAFLLGLSTSLLLRCHLHYATCAMPTLQYKRTRKRREAVGIAYRRKDHQIGRTDRKWPSSWLRGKWPNEQRPGHNHPAHYGTGWDGMGRDGMEFLKITLYQEPTTLKLTTDCTMRWDGMIFFWNHTHGLVQRHTVSMLSLTMTESTMTGR